MVVKTRWPSLAHS